MRKSKSIISKFLLITMLLNISFANIPVVNAAEPEYTYDSFVDVRNVTNLAENASFEAINSSSSPTNWTTNGILTTSTEKAYSGERSGLVTPHFNVNQWLMFAPDPMMSVKEGRYYLFSVMASWAGDNDKEIEIQRRSSVLTDTDADKTNEKSARVEGVEWKLLQMEVTANADSSENIQPCVTIFSEGAQFYIDDYYFGELMVAGIDLSTVERTVQIPNTGSDAQTLALSGKAINQLGNEEGLGTTNAPVSFSLAEDKTGVSIENNVLSVDSTASSTTKVKVKATCNPEKLAYQLTEPDDALKTAYTSGREKVIEITLLPNDDERPQVRDVIITGTVGEGLELHCTYDYYRQNYDDTDDASIIKWYAKGEGDSDFAPIEPEATGEYYTVAPAYADCSIMAKVTPKSIGGDMGSRDVESNILTSPKAPEAKNVRIQGRFSPGRQLVAKYDLYDANGDTVEPEFQWIISDGTLETIVGTDSSYIIQDEDVDKEIRLAVIPHTTQAPQDGAAVYTDWFSIVSNSSDNAYLSYSLLRDSTNLALNTSFEDVDDSGAPTSWKTRDILTTSTEKAYSGERSGLVTPHFSVNQWLMFAPNPTMTVKAGRYYIFSIMASWAGDNDKEIEIYRSTGLTDTDDDKTNEKSVRVEGVEWKHFQMEVTANENSSYIQPCVTIYSEGAQFYIDDYYFGELMVADIDLSSIEKNATIPKDNEAPVEIPLTAKALNQLGNEEGLGDNAPVEFTLIEDKTGVSISDGKLIIDSKATINTPIKVKATCNPEKLAYQLTEPNADLREVYLSGREQTFEVTLSPNDYLKPRALDIAITGSPNAGTEIGCTYFFAQIEGKSEGASTYQWYVKDNTDENAEFEPISGAVNREYSIDPSYTDHSFKVVITPVTTDGVVGDPCESAPLVKPTAPVVTNAYITGEYEDFAIGDTLTAKYTYYDVNDFNNSKESGTVIKWYRVGKSSDTLIHTGEEYTLVEDDVDHYIYITVDPNSSEAPNNDTVYPSLQYMIMEEHDLEIEVLLEMRRQETNMYTNPSFEIADEGTNVPSDWLIQKTNTWPGITRTSSQKYSGDYSAYVNPKKAGDGGKLYYQTKILEKGKTYLASAMVLPGPGFYDVTEFYQGVSFGAIKTDTSSITVPQAGEAPTWKRSTVLFENTSDAAVSPAFTVTSWKEDNPFYVDDYYLGELMVGYIDCSEVQTTAAIPKKGQANVVIPLYATAYNQIGTLDGLANGSAPISWSIKNDKHGVYVDGNELVITDEAMCDTKVKLVATCNPIFLGADEQTGDLIKGRTKVVEITLLTHDDKIPRAENVHIKGRVETGSQLECEYDFVQVDGEEEVGTEIVWLAKKSGENGYSPIVPAATGKYYTVTSEYANAHIIARVTPKTSTQTGAMVESHYVYMPVVPVASNVKITNVVQGQPFAVDETLKVAYTYFDDNGDEEGDSIIKWYKVEEGTETLIATAPTYTVTEGDIGKEIIAKVTPVSTELPYTDDAQYPSPSILAAAYPVADNVKVTPISGNLVGGSFDYSHPSGVPQGNSKYEWYISDTYLSSGSTFNAENYAGRTIILKVTPVATKKPFEGSPVTVLYTVPTSTSGDSGNGSSDRYVSSGGAVIPPVTGVVNVDKYPEWMRPGLTFVLTNNIMTNVTADEFMPDAKITRADFLYYVMKTLGLEASEYTGIFADVSSTDRISGYLQTAVDKGIISRDINFNPNRNVSRMEICKILIEGVKTLQPQANLTAAELTFNDSYQIQNWATDYVKQAIGIKLLNGMSQTEFAPLGDTTRAQTATMVMRLYNYLQGVKGGN